MNTRRDLLKGGLLGAGLVGLRALLTGVPLGLLTRPVEAWGDTSCLEGDRARAQYLIFSLSSAGDPMNTNTPGMYGFGDIRHPAQPAMAATQFTLGGRTVTAAKPWADLPQDLRDRLCFFHLATGTNNHPNLGKVMRLMGQTAASEQVLSIYAKALAPCLGTVQREPVLVGAEEVLTFEGRGLPSMAATGLRDVLTKPTGPLSQALKLRDQSLDRIHAALKARGTSAQRAYLDRLARSREEARQLSDQLLSNLSMISSDGADGQVVAAATLVKMNLAPVLAIRVPFGGDNHSDPELTSETNQTVAGTAAIAALWAKLKEYGVQDQVTFAMLNVFGRTPRGGNSGGREGRDHWASHNTGLIFGKGVRPGVIGGVEPKNGDYFATGIDSKTGAAGSDVPFAETLSAFGKTLGAAVGVSGEVLDKNISGGKIVTAALASG